MRTVMAKDYLTDPGWRGYTLLDVRSPGEYRSGHLPGAHSLPLFDDAERAEVGTLYKQASPDAALLRGLEIAGGKMRRLVEDARAAARGNTKVVVHCWRGGSRSGSVGWLLGQAGLEVCQLTGGYKAARRYIKNYLATSPHDLRVLSGPTGSGKTEVLSAMRDRGISVIDLEGLANHKGSSFGAIGQAPQPTTEQFENDLFAQLREIPEGNTVWLEDESRMIGHVYQPDEFYGRLTAAPVLVIEQPTEWRVERLVKDYGRADLSLLQDAFTRIGRRLGGQHLNTALKALDTGDLAAAARVALVYYDKAYRHYADRRQPNVVTTINAAGQDAGAVAEQIARQAPVTS